MLVWELDPWPCSLVREPSVGHSRERLEVLPNTPIVARRLSDNASKRRHCDTAQKTSQVLAGRGGQRQRQGCPCPRV